MCTEAVRTFVSQLREARLLPPAEQQEAERLAQTAGRPADLAGELVRRGWLTPYQANQVARGRGGELVVGSYVILEPLARGGMGHVFKARHSYLRRLVALKLIRPEHRLSQDSVQRFQREACLLAGLEHPHIVQAHDAGTLGDVWFLAMELLAGLTLDRLLEQSGALPVGEACLYALQAAVGLQHAHEHGLVHRDIKPSNLFLTAAGVKLLDLGLARPQASSDGGPAGGLTRTNTLMGTPDYLAPEQALDASRADARSDLYSLGCTLYFLLAGRPPFPGGTLAQKLLRHQQAVAVPVETLRPDVPPAVSALVRRLLAKDPGQRPAGAAEVASCLAPFAAAAPPRLPAAIPTGVSAGGLTGPGAAGAATAAAPSLIDSSPTGPQRGFTLVADSVALAPPPVAALPPAASPVVLPVAAVIPVVAPLAPPGPWGSRRVGLVAGVAVGGALALLVAALALGWFSPSGGATGAQGPQAGKPPGQAAGPPPPKEIAELWLKLAAPQALKPSGQLEWAEPVGKPFDVDPALLNEPPFRKVFLNDLKEFGYKGDLLKRPFGKDGVSHQFHKKQPFEVLGRRYPKGLHIPLLQPESYNRVRYVLGKRARSLHGAAALADSTLRGNLPPHAYRFAIFADDQLRWRSSALKNYGAHETFELDVRGVDVVELRCYPENDPDPWSATVWLDPFVIVDPSPSASAPPKVAAEPKPAPPAPKPDPGPAAAGAGEPSLNVMSELTASDPLDARRRGARCKIWQLKLTRGKRYEFDMKQTPGTRVDPFLRVEDAAGKVLAEDDDGGGGLNARIVFTASETGVYRLVATSCFGNQTGSFLLTARELP